MNENLTAKAARECQVPEQFHRIGKGLEELHAQIDRLEQKISSSLSPGTPTGSDGNQARAILVPLADELNKCGERLEGAINRIGDLISRCEL